MIPKYYIKNNPVIWNAIFIIITTLLLSLSSGHAISSEENQYRRYNLSVMEVFINKKYIEDTLNQVVDKKKTFSSFIKEFERISYENSINHISEMTNGKFKIIKTFFSSNQTSWNNTLKKTRNTQNNALFALLNRIGSLFNEVPIQVSVNRDSIEADINLEPFLLIMRDIVIGQLFSQRRTWDMDDVYETVVDKDYNFKESFIKNLQDSTKDLDKDIVNITWIDSFKLKCNININTFLENNFNGEENRFFNKVIETVSLMTFELSEFYAQIQDMYTDGKRKVHIIETELELSPFVDGAGNLYIAKKTGQKLSHQRLNEIFIHEAMHLRAGQQQLVNIIRNYLDEFNEILAFEHDEPSQKTIDQEKIKKMLGIFSDISELVKSYHKKNNEDFRIDRLTAAFLKKEQERYAYQKMLDNNYHRNENILLKSRIDSLGVFNQYFDEHFNNNNFEIIFFLLDYFEQSDKKINTACNPGR